jgi:FlaA1/EpsC-like NDP-sugar epimerase
MDKPQGNKIEVIIVGAGKAGELLAEDIENHSGSGLHIVGFVDDNEAKQTDTVSGFPVLGKIEDLPELVKENSIEELIIALPSERGSTIRTIVEKTTGLGLGYKILPRLSEILRQDFTKDYLQYVRRVRAEDLLGGEILKSDQDGISDYAKGQTILITGAAGSIGSELSRQIVSYGAKTVVLYDWWENGIFDLRNQILENYPEMEVAYIIGDIKDRKKISQVLKQYQPNTIFHAAAYKHVPLMEGNPAEAVKNNILGTKTVAEEAVKNGVSKFILVSTDKAVNPTNVMGATKRAAEKVIHILAKSQSTTSFCAVRFGNVINSNGSAIPTFEKQIETGGPVTVTHRDITRFFMTIPEAVHLILQSWVMGENDDLFVLDMGESIKIYELARLLITIHGYTPDEDLEIKIIGLRPGEKIYEEVLVQEEETNSTTVNKVFRTKNHHDFDRLKFLHDLNEVLETVNENSLEVATVKDGMMRLVETYKPAAQ